MEQYLLVTFDTNWADEMDITGFKVLSKSDWESWKESIPVGMFPMELYFGTNEGNEYEDKESLLAEYSERMIIEEDAKTLLYFFPDGFGEFPTLEWQIADYLEESNIETGDED